VKLAALIGLALKLLLFLQSALKRRYTTMDLFGVIFFMLLAPSSLVLGEGDRERLRSWSGVLIHGGLGGLFLGHDPAGRPLHKRVRASHGSKGYWQSSLFLNSTKSMALGWSTAFLAAAAISLACSLIGFGSSIIYAMGIGCMVIAVLWHSRVLAASEAEGGRLREAAKKHKAR
jgi:hypothetical protein